MKTIAASASPAFIDTRIRWRSERLGLTIEELAAKPDHELLKLGNFGRKTVKRLRQLVPKNSQCLEVALSRFSDADLLTELLRRNASQGSST